MGSSSSRRSFGVNKRGRVHVEARYRSLSVGDVGRDVTLEDNPAAYEWSGT